jgi:hypothetical protein
VIDVLLTRLRQLTGKDITMAATGLVNCLLPYLGGADVRVVLDAAATSQDAWARDCLMSRLAPCLGETEAIAVASAIAAPLWKARAFVALALLGDSPLRVSPDWAAGTAWSARDAGGRLPRRPCGPVATHQPDARDKRVHLFTLSEAEGENKRSQSGA